MPTFGERLKELRNEKKLTLDELKDNLNTTKATLSRYENNKRDPKIDFANKAANYFGVSLDYMLGVTDEKDIKTPESNINLKDNLNKETQIKKAETLKDDLIELMIKRGIIKDEKSINNEHLNLIEMSIKTYADKKIKKQDES